MATTTGHRQRQHLLQQQPLRRNEINLVYSMLFPGKGDMSVEEQEDEEEY